MISLTTANNALKDVYLNVMNAELNNGNKILSNIKQTYDNVWGKIIIVYDYENQTETKKGIEFFKQFVELYPESPYAEQAYKEMGELYDKLAEKEYLSARLYYNLGTYLGNNYLSAEIIAKNALKDYPTNQYQEQLSWIVLQAKYQQTIHSVDSKKEDRARDTEDEYYSFITEYPNSKHITAAEKINKEIQKILH